MNAPRTKNLFRAWNKSESTSIRGDSPDLAANRIFDGFFEPKNIDLDAKFSKADGVFTMGSCFARELEHAFSRDGFNVLSMNRKAVETANFKDETGKTRTGFFHRYNMPAMLQEFQRAFGEIDFREDSTLLIESSPGKYADLNYVDQPVRTDLAGVLERRAIGKTLVQTARQARIIIVTLGLTEAWFYKPHDLYANSVPGDVLARRRDEFEIRQIGYAENLSMLEAMYALLRKHHVDGDFHFVVTVSPVPLSSTFTMQDIVVANMSAKSTLRTAAIEFAKGKDNVSYFPSYEIVMYSNRDLVWRPDRIHVNAECVRFIVQTFRNAYVLPDVHPPINTQRERNVAV